MMIFSLNMREWGGAEKRRRIRNKISSGKFQFCMLQETKRSGITKKMAATVWGGSEFDFVSKDAEGQSGGLLCIWDNRSFDVQSSFSGEHFVGISAKIQDTLCYLVNAYSPCSLSGKRQLWDELRRLKEDSEEGIWCVAGDFNAVLYSEERRGISSNAYGI